MRTPVRYSTTPRHLVGADPPLFEGEVGRDPAVPVAEVASVRTPVLRIEVGR